MSSEEAAEEEYRKQMELIDEEDRYGYNSDLDRELVWNSDMGSESEDIDVMTVNLKKLSSEDIDVVAANLKKISPKFATSQRLVAGPGISATAEAERELEYHEEVKRIASFLLPSEGSRLVSGIRLATIEHTNGFGNKFLRF